MSDSIRESVIVQPAQGGGDASDWHWLSLHNAHGATLNVASIVDEEVTDFLLCSIKTSKQYWARPSHEREAWAKDEVNEWAMLLRSEWIYFKGNVKPGHISSMSHYTMGHGTVGWNEQNAFRLLAQDLNMHQQYPDNVDHGVDVALDPRLGLTAEASLPSTFVQALTPPSEDIEMLTTPDTASMTDDTASVYGPIVPTTGPASITGLLQEHANNGLKESD